MTCDLGDQRNAGEDESTIRFAIASHNGDGARQLTKVPAGCRLLHPGSQPCNPIRAEHDLYNGLTRLEPTLPSPAYWDADAYQRDLDAIWYKSWLLVCRDADLGQPLAYRTFRVGTQEIVVLRDETGELRAFHNTCRHRGSQLCQGSEGRLKARLLTCPYHAWSYSLRGDLVRVPSKSLPEGFERPIIRSTVWRCRNGAVSSSSIWPRDARRLGGNLIRSRVRQPCQLAAGDIGQRACASPR